MIRGVEELRIGSETVMNDRLRLIDREIEQLLATSQMGGSIIDLDYQARPSFLSSLEMYGFSHDLVLIRPAGVSHLAGLGIRSLRRAFLQGEPNRIGYLHHLRLHPEIRGGMYLARGYRGVRGFFTGQPAPVTLTSVLEENHSARKTLEANRNSASMPSYDPVSRYLTALIPLRGPGRRWPAIRRTRPVFNARMLKPDDFSLLQELFFLAGQKNDGVPAIGELLDESRVINGFPDLKIDDFIGIFANNQLVAACGLWNQQARKQIIIRKTGAGLNFIRRIWNAFELFFGRCPIPAPGEQVNQILLDPWVVLPGYEKSATGFMLAHAATEARKRGHDFAAWGVAEKHPAAPAAKSVYFIPYWSIIYQVYWPEHGPYVFGDKQLQLINLGAL